MLMRSIVVVFIHPIQFRMTISSARLAFRRFEISPKDMPNCRLHQPYISAKHRSHRYSSDYSFSLHNCHRSSMLFLVKRSHRHKVLCWSYWKRTGSVRSFFNMKDSFGRMRLWKRSCYSNGWLDEEDGISYR